MHVQMLCACVCKRACVCVSVLARVCVCVHAHVYVGVFLCMNRTLSQITQMRRLLTLECVCVCVGVCVSVCVHKMRPQHGELSDRQDSY